jgi:predicted dienelactone hydrolase
MVTTNSATGLLLVVLWPGLVAFGQERGDVFSAKSGSLQVETLLDDWTDQARNRKVPVKIYYPKTGEGPFPVILFSHGLGSTRERYAYLGRHWASFGYVSVHVQHKGSDADIWKGTLRPRRAIRRAAKDPKACLTRPPDISFAIDQMEKMNQQQTLLRGRLDLDHIGMAGHSFGGFATLAVAGQVFVGADGKQFTLADQRIKAAIVMSPSAPMKRAQRTNSFDQITVPGLHMTGTEDSSPLGLTTKADRRTPYDRISGADQYLITFQGADHAIFTDQERFFGSGEKDHLFRELIRISSTVFWEAYLRNDVRAKAWMAGDGFRSLLGQDGMLERKLH